MKKQLRFLAIILLPFLLFSCKNEVEKRIIGTWAIDKVYSTSADAEVFFRSNMITFKKKQVCTLPRFDKSQNEKGAWYLDNNNPGILHIEANNNPIQGTYQLELDDQDKLLKLKLISEAYTLNCSKLLHSNDTEVNTD